MASYGKIAKTSVLWGFMSRGFNEALAVPTSMILARVLTPQDFGIAAAVTFFVQLANRLTNFGFNTALVQLKQVDREHMSTVFAVNMLSGAVVWAALTFGAERLGQWFHSEDAAAALPVAALAFLIGPMSAVPAALLARDLRYREATLLDGLGTLVTATTSLLLAFLGFGFWSLVYSQVAGAFIPTIARLWVTGWWPAATFSMPALRELLAFGIGLHTKRLLDTAAQTIDNLVVGRMLGIVALGFYDRSFTTMNRALVLLNSAGPSISFRILAIIGDDATRFRSAYRKLLLTSTFIAYPAFAFLVVSAADLIEVMFGAQWGGAVLPFQILCIAGALKFVNGYASTATQSQGRVWGEVARQAAYLAAIVAGAGVGSRWGIAGAAAGVLVATLLMTALMHDYLTRATPVTWRDLISAQIPGLVCALMLAGLLAGSVMALRDVAPLARLSITTIASVVFVLLFVRLSPFVTLNAMVRESIEEFAPTWTWLVGSRSATESPKS